MANPARIDGQNSPNRRQDTPLEHHSTGLTAALQIAALLTGSFQIGEARQRLAP